jgi:formylglycine-generating enzyme required for sulfatase activity
MRLFISYSHHDREIADFIAAELRGQGAEVFIDYQRLEAGEIFSERVRQEVIACDAFILLVSTSAARSRWVQAETNLAHDQSKRIIPIMLERFDMANSPFWFLLNIERVDFFAGRGEAITKLVRSLGLSPEPARSPFEPGTVLVPAGPFLMGSTPGLIAAIQNEDSRNWAKKTQQSQRTITLPKYRIGKYPVTVGEYRIFVEAGGYHVSRYWTAAGWQYRERGYRTRPGLWHDPEWTGDDWLPVVGVNWYEAYAYCRWLAEAATRSYRLPTEAEWEKAARGTDGRPYPWGDALREGVCNTEEAGILDTTPVGRFSPAGDSPYGVADMAGNVWERCATRWRNRYREQADDDPEGDVRRVVRGGSWSNNWIPARTAHRNWNPPNLRGYDLGFRVVCAPASGERNSVA